MPIGSSFIRISAVTAALVGVLTQQACGSPTAAPTADAPAAPPPSSAPDSPEPTTSKSKPASSSSGSSGKSGSSGTSGSSGSSSSAGGVFSGKRQVWILPPATEGTLGVSASRKIELSDAFDDKTLFVLTPLGGDKYWIQTAKLRIGGEAYCLAVKGTTVQAVGCDAGAGNQQFRFRKTGGTAGKPEYTIRTGTDTYIIVTDQGGVEAAQIGEGTPDIDTPFLLPDKGKATLPSLD